MKTEMQVLEKLKQVITDQLALHYQEDGGKADLQPITEHNVSIDFPDIDNMRKDTMFYIEPDYENLEPFSMSSDLATMTATLFIITKGAKHETLIRRVFGYFTALYSLFGNNRSLDGFIESVRITDMDYYPAVTAGTTMTAIETSIELQWSKEY